jgi:hypothetical protein
MEEMTFRGSVYLPGMTSRALQALVSGDAINEKSRTDCKGFFHYCCHIRHSEVTEKVKIFGGCALITEKFRRAGGTYRQAAFDPTQKFPDGTNRAFAWASA